jgi:BMFP domain-containing protein YqiC
MQTQNRLLDDLARVATGALGALTGVRAEVELRLREQFERILARMDLVTREEFEAVRAMAAKARTEQEELARRVAALESRLDAAEGGPVAAAPAVSRPAKRRGGPGAEGA